jgi:antitoxin CptB
MNELKRLQWRCRRGMRELDLVFQTYLEQCYADAPVDERAAFTRLIEETDADIYAWLMGYAQSSDSELNGVLVTMRGLLSRSQ